MTRGLLRLYRLPLQASFERTSPWVVGKDLSKLLISGGPSSGGRLSTSAYLEMRWD